MLLARRAGGEARASSTRGCRPTPSAQIIETLEAIPPTIEGNREMLAWLRGERQWYDEAEKRHRRVQLIDFDDPADNVFHVTWEWTLEAAGPQGQPCRRDVRRQRHAGLHRRAQEPEGRRRHRARRSRSCAATRWRRPSCSARRSSSTSRTCSTTGMASPGTPTGASWRAGSRRRDETYRFAVQAFFEPTDFLRTLQHWILFYVEDGETRKSVLRAAPAPRDRQDRRPLRRPDQEPRPRLAHAGLGQDLHAADRRPADPRGQGAVPERDRHPRRRPHRARRPAEGLGRAAARRDAAAGHRRPAGQHQGRAAGAARRRLPRADRLDDPQVRGDREGQLARATTSTSSSTRRTARSPRTSAPT